MCSLIAPVSERLRGKKTCKFIEYSNRNRETKRRTGQIYRERGINREEEEEGKGAEEAK